MKKRLLFLTILTLVFFCFSCSKKNDVSEKTISIEVAEYKTDSPVIGALVEYYNPCQACGLFGGNGFKLVFSDRTGYGGICKIPESIFNNGQYGIVITPPPPPQNPLIDYSYLATGSPGMHSTAIRYFLPIMGEEKLKMKKVNSYAGAYYMEIKVQGEQASFPDVFITRIYGFPSDTSFSYTAYRGQGNNISLAVYDSAEKMISLGQSSLFEMPRTGIREIEWNY